MTTALYNTPIDHTSDAGFRAWSVELFNALITCGLVQTADTGQINFVTVLRPGTNTAGGYVILRFNDATQATAPIFMKLEFGTGSGATIPSMWLTVGTGSNGSGTITGTSTTRTTCIVGIAPSSTVTNYPTNVCVAPGYAGVSFKRGGASTGYYGFHICRSVSSAGTPSAEGVTVYRGAVGLNPISAQALCFTTATAFAASTAYCMIPMGITSSLVGTTAQVFKHYTVTTPRERPNPYLLTVIISEIASSTQFDAAPVAAVSHNYLSTGLDGGYSAAVNGTTGTGLAMLWE